MAVSSPVMYIENSDGTRQPVPTSPSPVSSSSVQGHFRAYVVYGTWVSKDQLGTTRGCSHAETEWPYCSHCGNQTRVARSSKAEQLPSLLVLPSPATPGFIPCEGRAGYVGMLGFLLGTVGCTYGAARLISTDGMAEALLEFKRAYDIPIVLGTGTYVPETYLLMQAVGTVPFDPPGTWTHEAPR